MDISTTDVISMTEGSLDLHELRESTYATVATIDRIEEPVSYGYFFSRYLLPNRACILGAWATESWRSRKEWLDEDGMPHLAFFAESFGSAQCCVANCGREEYSTHPKSNMTVGQYIDYLKKYRNEDDPQDMDCLYLKDWHFTRLFPEYEAYRVPEYFASDWLNEYWDSRHDEEDDYRFVYFGPKGSWTSFHSDVFRSYSWSANIVGCKRWIFFPPGEEEKLKDTLGNLVYDLDSEELMNAKKYPNACKVTKRFEVLQHAGEVIFVPSGWHHQVYNMEDTISINHNWLNGCNIDLAWAHIKQSLADVQREIDDCRDMEGWNNQCQLVLKCSSGIDYPEFYRFLCTIAQRRLSWLDRLKAIHAEYDTKTDSENPNTASELSESCEKTNRAAGSSMADEPHSAPELESCTKVFSGEPGSSEEPSSGDVMSDCCGVPAVDRLKREAEAACTLPTDKQFKQGIPHIHNYKYSREPQEGTDLRSSGATVERQGKSEGTTLKWDRATSEGSCERSDGRARENVPYYDHLSCNHVIFDLCRIKSIVEDMVTVEEFNELDSSLYHLQPSDLLSELTRAISVTTFH